MGRREKDDRPVWESQDGWRLWRVRASTAARAEAWLRRVAVVGDGLGWRRSMADGPVFGDAGE